MLTRDRLIFAFIIIIVNHLLPISFIEPSYVPVVANGVLTALSLLAAISAFLATQAYHHIEDSEGKKSYARIVTRYLYALLFIIWLVVMAGYRFIVIGNVEWAYYLFTDAFIFSVALVWNLFAHGWF
jgi:hypothetical protein